MGLLRINIEYVKTGGFWSPLRPKGLMGAPEPNRSKLQSSIDVSLGHLLSVFEDSFFSSRLS